jgi:ElaB/YqjD/DUF883 family membrane-anchored ribosome-binding protein
MSKHTTVPVKDMQELAEEARALMNATVHVAGDKVAKARKRLAAALERDTSDGEEPIEDEGAAGEVRKCVAAVLERGKGMYDGVRDKAIEEVKAADQTVRGKPYHAIGIALGVGALLGFIVSHLGSRSSD